jgi:hypothetical protein
VRPSGIVLILPYKVECSRQGKKLAFDFLKSALSWAVCAFFVDRDRDGCDRRRSGGARPSRRRYFHQPHSGHTALAADSMSPARAHLLGPLPKGSLLLQHHGVCNELALLRLLHQAIRT